MKKKSKILIAIFSVLFLILALIFGIIFYVRSSLKLTDKFLNGEICENGQAPCDFTVFIVEEGLLL